MTWYLLLWKMKPFQKEVYSYLKKFDFTLKCLNFGTPNTTTFPFVANGQR